MKYSYTTDRRVCSSRIDVEIEDGIVVNVKITDGCAGNTQGVAALCKGRPVQDVIDTLSGINCKGKGTSCPDQVAQALKAAMAQAE